MQSYRSNDSTIPRNIYICYQKFDIKVSKAFVVRNNGVISKI